MIPDDRRHGTISGYKYRGCRCVDCRAASVRYEKGRRWLIHCGIAPTVPAIGFNRRVHSLMAIGWTQKEIAAELGIAQGNLALKLRTNETVRRATHVAMVEVYERLCMTRRDGMAARRTAAIAARRGWVPPLGWDDIDDPAESPAGWQYEATPRAAALTDLVESGYHLSEAVRQLGISASSLERWCERNGLRAEYMVLLRRERGDAA